MLKLSPSDAGVEQCDQLISASSWILKVDKCTHLCKIKGKGMIHNPASCSLKMVTKLSRLTKLCEFIVTMSSYFYAVQL